MDLAQSLAQERRARLAAERLLEHKQVELSVANRELSKHARALSVEVIEKREEVEGVRQDLEIAETKVSIAERRLWTSLTTIRDGFAVFDRNDVLVAANPAWLKPFDGLAAVKPGANYHDILTLAVEEGMIDIGRDSPLEWRDRMRNRWTGDRIEPEVIRLWNGSYIRLVDQRGDGGDMVSLALDITAQMRNEARLKDARRRAEAANRAKSAFLANMSHELRTPMNGVVAMADMLAETRLDEEQQSFVDTIRSSGEALLVIINDILDVSKFDAQKMILHPAPFDLEQTVHEVLQLVRPLAQQKELSLQVDYDMFLPTRFIGDAGRMRQVLTNLVGNAVKFTDAGQVLVRITGLGDGDGWRVHVTVEDTGIGIRPEMLRHVFGEFNQVEDQRNRKYEGTGLGLAITERLVRLMQGEIWVDSEFGAGSCFGFRIPLPQDEEAMAPLPTPRHVVVIDPDPSDCLRSQLLSLGMEVTFLRDPTSALADLPVETGLILAVAPVSGTDLSRLTADLAGRGILAPVVALAAGSGAETGNPEIKLLHRPVSRHALADLLATLPAPVLTPLQTIETAGAGPLRQMKVLAAEDNKTNQMVLGKMLCVLDIDLRFANDGFEAVAMHGDWRPDMIFMDISMPGMDGKEATRRIRAAEAGTDHRTPICALTAHALEGDEAQILSAGLDRYLTKPLRKAAIHERIQSWRPADCRPVQPESGRDPELPESGVTSGATPGTPPLDAARTGAGPAADHPPSPAPRNTQQGPTLTYGFASRRSQATAAE